MASIAAAIERIKNNPLSILDAELIRRICEEHKYVWRDRVLDPAATIALFMQQILHGNVPCAEVRHLAASTPWASAGGDFSERRKRRRKRDRSVFRQSPSSRFPFFTRPGWPEARFQAKPFGHRCLQTKKTGQVRFQTITFLSLSLLRSPGMAGGSIPSQAIWPSLSASRCASRLGGGVGIFYLRQQFVGIDSAGLC